MSKLNPSFMDEIEKDIKSAQTAAEVIKETQVVNFAPIYNEDITEKSLEKHVDFINRQGAIVHAATTNIAYDNYGDTGKKEWTGVMDFGCMQITAMTQMADKVDDNNTIYGNADLFFDYKHSDDLNAWYEHFMEVDHDRCQKLFAEEKTATKTK